MNGEAASATNAIDRIPMSLRVGLVAIAIGIGAGIGGIALTWLLRAVQRVAYAYPAGLVPFLDGVEAATHERRFVVMLICGLVVAFAWRVLDRYGRPRVTAAHALEADDPKMPVITTSIHAALQIVTVALGSPLGREVAPREVGAAFGGWLAARAGLSIEQRRTMIACGAGAGLAAVYNVPVAGALFTMEVVLRTRDWRPLLAAIATSVVAAWIGRLGLGDVTQYAVHSFAVDASLILWSVVAGPLIGIAAFAFKRACDRVRLPDRPHEWRIAIAAIVAFACIGVLAGSFPEVLGNGKNPAQLAFDGLFGSTPSAVLLIMKVAVVMMALAVGASGGLLTPSVACGALFATVLGSGWSLLWPGPASGAYALVGAAAFLAAAQSMPLTAIALLFELTHASPGFFVPIILAVAGATVCSRLSARFVRPVRLRRESTS